MAQFQLNILGCGSATCTLRHLPSSQVLDIRDQLYMIDCGEGAQLQMRRMGLKFSRLNHIFISHLHGDHVFGLPGLISTMALLQKGGTLTVHIFKDGAEQFGRILDYFCRDMPFEVKFNIIGRTDDVIYENDAIEVRTFPLFHRVPAVGFRFTEKPKLRHINPEMTAFHEVPRHFANRLRNGEDFVKPDGTVIPNDRLTTPADPCVSYAYCSDTVRNDRVASAVSGVDWLYHEATYDSSLSAKAIARGHSTAADAAEIARRAGARHLIIGHFSKRYTDDTILLDDARGIFPSTILANEGMKLPLNEP
ncbi:MAG: ribonuclease Z [Muribaculaceae bacterium]